MRPFGFNIVGPVSANAGMGVTARNIVRVLLQRGFPVALLDVDPGLGRGKHDRTYESLMVTSEEEFPYGINVSVFSITALPYFLFDHRSLMRRDTLNVGFYVWELTALPEMWKRSLELFDVLVAESDFIRSTFQNAVSQVPTIAAIHPLALPSDVVSDRARFDIPADAIVFVCIVEPASDPERKNPFATIDAFQHAFGHDDRVRLVVKVNNASHDGNPHPLVTKIRARCEGHPSIQLLEESLPYRDVLTLYASCDVFVSLHRSEGFGLGPLEAMALGKPVIATGWSGNMTYMNHCNACLVPYELVPVDGSIPVYSRKFLGRGALWADPDLAHASAWMKALANDEDLRTRIGNRAKESSDEFRQKGERAEFADELRAIWESRALLPERPAWSERDFIRLREVAFEHSASMTELAAKRARNILDRHVLWRFGHHAGKLNV